LVEVVGVVFLVELLVVSVVLVELPESLLPLVLLFLEPVDKVMVVVLLPPRVAAAAVPEELDLMDLVLGEEEMVE
jgi:hypothetical protein